VTGRIVAKWKSGLYLPERPSSWIKIRNRSYSQWAGREELFERERAATRISGVGISASGRVPLRGNLRISADVITRAANPGTETMFEESKFFSKSLWSFYGILSSRRV